MRDTRDRYRKASDRHARQSAINRCTRDNQIDDFGEIQIRVIGVYIVIISLLAMYSHMYIHSRITYVYIYAYIFCIDVNTYVCKYIRMYEHRYARIYVFAPFRDITAQGADNITKVTRDIDYERYPVS